jgi:hypothetical protein
VPSKKYSLRSEMYDVLSFTVKHFNATQFLYFPVLPSVASQRFSLLSFSAWHLAKADGVSPPVKRVRRQPHGSSRCLVSNVDTRQRDPLSYIFVSRVYFHDFTVRASFCRVLYSTKVNFAICIHLALGKKTRCRVPEIWYSSKTQILSNDVISLLACVLSRMHGGHHIPGLNLNLRT